MCGTTFMNHLRATGARFKECNVYWKRRGMRRGAAGVALACVSRRRRASDAQHLEQRRPATVTLRCVRLTSRGKRFLHCLWSDTLRDCSSAPGTTRLQQCSATLACGVHYEPRCRCLFAKGTSSRNRIFSFTVGEVNRTSST